MVDYRRNTSSMPSPRIAQQPAGAPSLEDARSSASRSAASRGCCCRRV